MGCIGCTCTPPPPKPVKSNYTQVLDNTGIYVPQQTWLSSHPKLTNHIYNFEVLRPNQCHIPPCFPLLQPLRSYCKCMVLFEGLCYNHMHKCDTLPSLFIIYSCHHVNNRARSQNKSSARVARPSLPVCTVFVGTKELQLL